MLQVNFMDSSGMLNDFIFVRAEELEKIKASLKPGSGITWYDFNTRKYLGVYFRYL